ncbi:MAG: hypothetical protein IJW93_00740 [Clostridia bacterium]|nr:hypothetical protein [Clostridia bacterium]
MKKFLRYFNFMEPDLTLRSYKSPIIRILISALVMMVVCVFRFSITIPQVALNIIVSILVFGIFILAFLCFAVAAVEALQVGENKRKDKERANDKYK